MSEQRRRLERALRGCAERWVPQRTDPWPAIRERVSGTGASETRGSGAQASEDRAAYGPRRSPLLVPNRPLGWVLAALSVLILGLGVYGASGPLRELIANGTPGPAAPGPGEATNPERPGGPGIETLVYGLFRSEVPGGGEELRQTESAGGARVTLLRAYADAGTVVAGFTFEDLEGGRRLAGRPARLLPGYDMGSFGIRLTDESGGEFRFVSGGGQVSSGTKPIAQTVVFKPEGDLRSDGAHRFRLEIPLIEVPDAPPGVDTDEFRRVGEPIVLDFEVPVRPAPVVEVNRRATAGGITLTLERVTDSPGQPKAVICMEPREGVRGWFPGGRDLSYEGFRGLKGEGDCLEMVLRNDLSAGPSSVTVEQVELNPVSDGEVVRGPWTFEFEVPEP